MKSEDYAVEKLSQEDTTITRHEYHSEMIPVVGYLSSADQLSPFENSITFTQTQSLHVVVKTIRCF